MKNEVFLLCILVLLPSVLASNLYVGTNEEGLTILPFTYNQYYSDVLYVGGEPNQVSPLFTLLDQGSTITPSQSGKQFAVYSDIDFGKTYSVEYANERYPITFCNNNGVCEPCDNGHCSLIENALSCPNDCHSGSSDNYCDLVQDGICDSDCEYYDFDCDTCINNVCITEEKETSSCVDIGGVFCNKQCDGYFTYSDDAGMSCCIGSCTPKETSSSLETTLETQGTPKETFDWTLFSLMGLIVLILLVSVVLIVIFESKSIRKEHEIRSYVHKLQSMGYTQEQIRNALQKQRIDADIIFKVIK